MPESKTLIFAAIAEAVTGLALLLVPSMVVRLLLGSDPAGITIPVARVAGIALIGLGLACWPGPPILGMAAYGVLVSVLLAYWALTGSATGILLWPAIALHILLAALLIRRIARLGIPVP